MNINDGYRTKTYYETGDEKKKPNTSSKLTVFIIISLTIFYENEKLRL